MPLIVKNPDTGTEIELESGEDVPEGWVLVGSSTFKVESACPNTEPAGRPAIGCIIVAFILGLLLGRLKGG